MTFLHDSTLWPVDITGENIFLVKAVQEAGRALLRANTRLPSCLYKYDVELPDFAHASEDQKAFATQILMNNTSDEHVEIIEQPFYSEKAEKSVVIRNYLISRDQWLKAGDIVSLSQQIHNDNIVRAVAITAAIFEGIAAGKVSARRQPIGVPDFLDIPKNLLNIFDSSVIKTRLSLGQIDTKIPLDLNSRGSDYIFLARKELESWRKTDGKSSIRIEVAKAGILQHIKNKSKGWKSPLKKEDWLGKDMTEVTLTSVEQDKLWEKLPDDPFKIHGLRPNPS